MNDDQLVSLLDNPSAAAEWLKELGVKHPGDAHERLVAMANNGITLDLLCEISRQLSLHLPSVGDPDLALRTLGRFVAASRNPLSFGSLIEEDEMALPVLLRFFSASPMLGDLLVADPASYDLLRVTEGQPATRAALIEEICSEIANLTDSGDLAAALRNFKRRETLRIAYGEIVTGQPVSIVAQQLTYVADALCEAALRAARRQLTSKHGKPKSRSGDPSRFVLIGLGRFGGQELDYNNRLESIFIYDADGRTDGDRPVDNYDFFDKLIAKTRKLLADETEDNCIYDLSIENSPASFSGKSCLTANATFDHFDTRGRTWERQALIKARPVAGDVELGLEFLDAMEPWVYRRYLNRSDVTGIKALKRRLERRTDQRGSATLDVEADVSDIEFLVQFLQLINGGDHRELRVGNTVTAIGHLEQTGCITPEESQTLEANYEWLRRVEHRLEILHSPATAELPDGEIGLRRLALGCGYLESEHEDLARCFCRDYDERKKRNQEIICRLLEETFAQEATADPEADLVLDPDPSVDGIHQVLSPYQFRDLQDAYHHLCALATEGIPFLSTRRCRHFLSLIAKPLLQAISQTPSPDATLANLCRVSDSIGGKGVLWGLFNAHPPSLDLYVRLCSSSPYLSSILTRYPGMIDELFDSLMLAELPTLGELQITLNDLCGNVDDIEPVLHSFKNTQHLNVGVRELLGKADIQTATKTLADVAEACVQRIVHDQLHRLTRKYGQPRIGIYETPCEFVVVAMGKFGGREPNYHSDVDIIFLYEADGSTCHPPTIRNRETTTNQHFFSELGQRIVKAISKHGANGKLYDLDSRLRPLDMGGPVAVSLDEFRNYYLLNTHPFSRVRGLCQARPVYGSEQIRGKTAAILQQILTSMQVSEVDEESVRQARLELQSLAGPRNIKRGPGGTVDIEFITQLLQLRHVKQDATILKCNTLDAIGALAGKELLASEDAASLSQSYRFLRGVEAKLRLLNTSARHDLPREADELAKLAYLLRFDKSSTLEAECARCTRSNRQMFDKLTAT